MTAPIHHWLIEPLAPDVAAALARLAASDDVHHIAVMPDVHLAGEVCIGTVMATRRLLYPEAVGGDIGCGMAAIRLTHGADLVDDPRTATRLLSLLTRAVPTLRHPIAAARILPSSLCTPLSDPRLETVARREAPVELGTLGRGNHFLELQSDDQGALWLMLHTGSRALGQAIRNHHLRPATRGPTGLYHLDSSTSDGAAYLNDVAWALTFADENRRSILSTVHDLLTTHFATSLDPSTMITCHHNHVRRELHSDQWLFIHRKGAIPASLDEPGIIPGSMGTPSYHVTGRGHPDSLHSSSHGAGRVMARAEARRSISVKDFRREMSGVWFDHRLSERLRDEAPSAYKNIRAVMRSQRELTRVERQLRPLLSLKGI